MIRKVIIVLSVFKILSIATAIFAFELPDSGQTKCYQAVSPYAEIGCAGTGQDGAYSINPMSYADNGNGTVTDNNTGLMWQRCSAGRSNDATCSGTATNYNWHRASGTYDPIYNPYSQSVCGSFLLGDHDDWRLPSGKELVGIADYSVAPPGPMINETFFPHTDTSLNYWSSTGYSADSGSAWAFGFNWGFFDYANKHNYGHVRCVRGPQELTSLSGNGDGTVTDNQTGLIWQQGEPGEMNWGAALDYCEDLYLGLYNDWRLPNVKELASLADYSRYAPSIDTTLFAAAIPVDYWSSTTKSDSQSYARTVHYQRGVIANASKGGYAYVRCVRGWPGALLPVRIVGPPLVYFATLQEAYDGAVDGDIIEAVATSFAMNLMVDRRITIKGGRNGDYTESNDYTILQGSLIVRFGSLVLEGLDIR